MIILFKESDMRCIISWAADTSVAKKRDRWRQRIFGPTWEQGTEEKIKQNT